MSCKSSERVEQEKWSRVKVTRGGQIFARLLRFTETKVNQVK